VLLGADGEELDEEEVKPPMRFKDPIEIPIEL
jgi:hypothetical protein